MRPVHANCFDRGSNPQGSDWIQWYINKYLNVTQWIMSSWMWQWIFYHLVKIFFEGHVFFPVCHHILNDSMNDYYWSYQEADYQPQRVPNRLLRDPGISRDSQKSNPGIFRDFQKPLNDYILRLSIPFIDHNNLFWDLLSLQKHIEHIAVLYFLVIWTWESSTGWWLRIWGV